ncbi:MAG: alpha-hydroxy-acid oxidizing protein [Cytophagaceae bacterium]|nr:alpha-hydroxy-acid oxidizing protein [Gemmatimonadaceae bacterium]
MTDSPSDSRRRFLRFLAASPLAPAFMPGSTVWGEWASELVQGRMIIRSPEEALSVMDFEPAAHAALPGAHFGYMASGVDDDVTLRANSAGYGHFGLRPRRLVDVRNVDTTLRLLDGSYSTPIFVCPCGSQRAFHAEGELATARAAGKFNILQMLSGVTTTSVEDVNAARRRPVWYQLYPTNVEAVAQAIAKRAQRAGCQVLILTVDLNAGRNLETQMRSARVDARECADCHVSGFPGVMRRKPMFDGVDLAKVTGYEDPGMTWEYVQRMRQAVPGMKLVIKGIVTAIDARLAVQHGVDAIVVSNHGGRAEESGKATIDSLAEVVQAVAGRIPVMLDGGVRRGTDVFKALALGATAVGVGRPYLWGLAAFGQKGVEAVLVLLQKELELTMRQMGTTNLAAIRTAKAVEPSR